MFNMTQRIANIDIMEKDEIDIIYLYVLSHIKSLILNIVGTI